MNDSRPPEPDRLLADGPLDVAFLQFSGAIWYPMVYDYPDNAQHVLGHKKRVAQLARAFRYIEVLDPAFVVPPPGRRASSTTTCSSSTTSRATSGTRSRTSRRSSSYIEEQGRAGGRLMLPGTVADIAPGRIDVTHPVDPATIFDDKRAYLEAYQARKRARDRGRARALGAARGWTSCAELQAWWDPLLEQADMICAGIDQPVLLDCGDERIVIDFAQRVVRRPLDDEDPRYQFAVAARTRRPPRPRHVDDWVNELFLSMRFTRPSARPVQRLHLHVVQVPQRGAAPVRRGVLRRARADPGHVRARRLQRPASLSAHEGRPDPLRVASRTAS